MRKPYVPDLRTEQEIAQEEQDAIRRGDGFFDLILLPAAIIGWSWLGWRWWKERKAQETQS